MQTLMPACKSSNNSLVRLWLYMTQCEHFPQVFTSCHSMLNYGEKKSLKKWFWSLKSPWFFPQKFCINHDVTVTLLVFHFTWLHCSVSLGSFISNNDGDCNENLTLLKQWICAALQTLSCLFHLVLFIKCWLFFLEFNFKTLYQSLIKRKRKVLSCVQILEAKKMWN